MKTIACTLAALLALSIILAADRNDKQQPQAESVSIECSLFYRGTPDKAFESKVFTIDISLMRGEVSEIGMTEKKVQRFDDMVVTLLYDVNMLKLQVTDAKSGAEIYGRLYQILPGLQNQFNGGHGFTGLGYINHPKSQAQLQTFCAVKQAK